MITASYLEMRSATRHHQHTLEVAFFTEHGHLNPPVYCSSHPDVLLQILPLIAYNVELFLPKNARHQVNLSYLRSIKGTPNNFRLHHAHKAGGAKQLQRTCSGQAADFRVPKS